jgi:hypothetical protein
VTLLVPLIDSLGHPSVSEAISLVDTPSAVTAPLASRFAVAVREARVYLHGRPDTMNVRLGLISLMFTDVMFGSVPVKPA